jgi:hypothetical protein
MAPTTRATARWAAVHRVTALPEFWALVAEHSGLVGAWRLTRVCKAVREGAKYWLRTLPGLVVCGGKVVSEEGYEVITSDQVWKLDLGELRWQEISSLVRGRAYHACCAVRRTVVVLGGHLKDPDPGTHTGSDEQEQYTDTVETLGYDQETGEKIFKPLPALSCGVISSCNAVAIDESESDQGQVLLIVCTPQPALLCGISRTVGRTYRGYRTGGSFAWGGHSAQGKPADP